MTGIIGIVWAGAAGGGPVVRTGSLAIKSPWMYCLNSLLLDQGNGANSLLSLDKLGQYTADVAEWLDQRLK